MSMMTHVPPSSSDRDAIREEVREEFRHEAKRRRIRGCVGCSLVAILSVAIPAIAIGIIVAKTGLARVPVLTAQFYKPTAPIREVVSLVGSTSEQLIRATIAGAKFDPATNTAAITVTEEQLTTVVRDAVGSGETPFPIELKDPQIAIQPDMMELFAMTSQNGTDVPVRIRLFPSIGPDGLTVETKEFVLGAYTAPSFMVGLMTNAMNRALADALSSFTGASTVTDVDIAAGKLKVTILVPQKP